MPPKSLQVLCSLKIVTVKLILCSVHISSVLREPLSSSCFHLVHPRPHRPSWRGTSSRSIIRQKTPVQARNPNLLQNATLFAPIVPHIFYLQKKLITPQPRNPNMQSNRREENPPNHGVEKKRRRTDFHQFSNNDYYDVQQINILPFIQFWHYQIDDLGVQNKGREVE